MTLHMNSLASKQIIFYSNLGPNNQSRSAQISHYWPQEFLGPIHDLKQALPIHVLVMASTSGKWPYYCTFKNMFKYSPDTKIFLVRIWYVTPIPCWPRTTISRMCKYVESVKTCGLQLIHVIWVFYFSLCNLKSSFSEQVCSNKGISVP